MKKRYLVFLGVIFLLCIVMQGCSEEKSDKEDALSFEMDGKENNKDENVQGRNKNIVVWTLPIDMENEGVEKSEKLINEKLMEDGFEFSIDFQTVSASADNYRSVLRSLLIDGKTDIVSLGIDMVDGSWGFAQDIIREGYLEELSPYLLSEGGKQLYEWYSTEEWKSVEVEGGIYCIPNQYGMHGNQYLAFNRKYVTEEMLQGFNGGIGEIKNLVEQVECPDTVGMIIGGFTVNNLAAMCGLQNIEGVFCDVKTGKAENPFLNTKFQTVLRDLNALYMAGYMKTTTREQQKEFVKDGNYVLWLGREQDSFYEEMKESFVQVPLPFVMENSVSSTIGISRNAANKEIALQLLTLLYTEEEYANLLLYGEEGKDYQILDGYVCDMEGGNLRVLRKNLYFGVYDAAFPCREDDLTINRRNVKNEKYSSKQRVDSILQGFHVNHSYYDQEMYGVQAVFEKYFYVWQADDFDTALQKAISEYESSGGNKLVEELNRQITEWMQKTKNK